MTNVIQLPDTFELQWRVYEGQIRAHFGQLGAATPNEIDYVVAQLKPIYLEAARMGFSSSTSVETLVQELNAWVNKQVFSMMQEIAIRDIELYRLRGEG